MELDGIVELGKLVHLTDQEMDTIRFLLPHYCLFRKRKQKDTSAYSNVGKRKRILWGITGKK